MDSPFSHGQHKCPNIECNEGLMYLPNGNYIPCPVCEGLGVIWEDAFTTEKNNYGKEENEEEE